MTTSYYKGSAGGVLVYDITQRSTFASISTWLQDFREFTDEKIKAILVGRCCFDYLGNKKDLAEQRQVPVEEAQALAQKEGLFFMETSAVLAAGGQVEEAFFTLLESKLGVKRYCHGERDRNGRPARRRGSWSTSAGQVRRPAAERGEQVLLVGFGVCRGLWPQGWPVNANTSYFTANSLLRGVSVVGDRFGVTIVLFGDLYFLDCLARLFAIKFGCF